MRLVCLRLCACPSSWPVAGRCQFRCPFGVCRDALAPVLEFSATGLCGAFGTLAAAFPMARGSTPRSWPIVWDCDRAGPAGLRRLVLFSLVECDAHTFGVCSPVSVVSPPTWDVSPQSSSLSIAALWVRLGLGLPRTQPSGRRRRRPNAPQCWVRCRSCRRARPGRTRLPGRASPLFWRGLR